MGHVCDKHQEYCPDGQCRWCEPIETNPVTVSWDVKLKGAKSALAQFDRQMSYEVFGRTGVPLDVKALSDLSDALTEDLLVLASLQVVNEFGEYERVIWPYEPAIWPEK